MIDRHLQMRGQKYCFLFSYISKECLLSATLDKCDFWLLLWQIEHSSYLFACWPNKAHWVSADLYHLIIIYGQNGSFKRQS